MATQNFIRCREKEKLLSAEYVRNILDYNSETGIFTWKYRPSLAGSSNRKNAGNPAGSKQSHAGHIRIKINGLHYWAHRLAWLYVTGEWPKEQIDHKNINSSDNKWNNLRESTHNQNNQNKRIPINCKSGIKGIRLVIKGNCHRYKVRIGVDSKNIHIGYFEKIEDAIKARQDAEIKYHGEFCAFK